MIQKTGISGQEKRRSSGFVSDMDGCALSQKKAEDLNRVASGGDMLSFISGVMSRGNRTYERSISRVISLIQTPLNLASDRFLDL